MFGFFKRKKRDDDPLSDLKTVSRWMQDLPTGDIYTAQEQVVQSLIQFNHGGHAMSKDRLNVLMHLDEQARDMQFSLCAQYLRNPRMSKVIESRLWTAIHAFYWEITRGYHAFLMDFVSNPGGNRIQPMIPNITARAIRGFADIFKWRYFRYEKVEEKLWMRMHNLYRIAEFEAFQDSRLKLYPGDTRQSTCAEEYIQALLLSPLGAGSLAPRQIEMVDHWLDNWSDLSRLDGEFDAGRHTFYVDAAKGQGLRRVRPDDTPEPGYRYLDCTRLREHIEQTERALKSGAPPATLGLGEEFRLPDGYDLLGHVANEWSANHERERRGSPRAPAEGRCEVVRDIGNITQRLLAEKEAATGGTGGHHLSPEEILDIKLYGFVTERTKSSISQRFLGQRDIGSEHWPMHDRSESGLGIVLRGEDSEWIKVGKLLAIRLDPAQPWLVGVIRRITRLKDDERKIGVQLIDAAPELIRLEQGESGAPLAYVVDDNLHDSDQPPNLGLVFPNAADGNLIILESARYAYGREYRVAEIDGARLIRLDNVRDKGDGWIMSTFTSIG